MTERIKADLCVIGAGSGGLSVAAGAAQLGRRVVLFEQGEMGGDCLNFGCVPSKALLAAAAAAQNAREAAKFGVQATIEIDFAAVMAHVRSVIAAIAPHDSQERFEGMGVRVVRARARLTGPRTIEGGGLIVRAKHIVIATGSRAAIPPIEGLDGVAFDTNETIFSHDDAPKRLLVIGGGPIGVELAQAHARLGAPVALIEAAEILPRADREAAALVRARLAAEGVTVLENTKVVRAAPSADDGATLTLDSGAELTGDRILVATGRRPSIADLGLETAGARIMDGRVVLDARLRTHNKRIFVIGDAAGGPQFTHLAGDHASTVIRNILFKASAKRRDAVCPEATYCDPEVASVGLTEEAAQDKHKGATAVRWTFAENDRAQAERRTEGFIKVVFARNGRVLGATIVGKGAGDEISRWAQAVAAGGKAVDFTKMIAAYPTRSEIAKRAGGAFFTPRLFSDRTRTLVRLLSVFD